MKSLILIFLFSFSTAEILSVFKEALLLNYLTLYDTDLNFFHNTQSGFYSNLILKGDVSGSVEALEDALVQLDVGTEVDLRVIHRGVGAITKNDVTLASASTAVIIGFNVINIFAIYIPII